MSNDKSDKKFRNGIAIVAGGSGGIGGAICEKLASQGVKVAFTYNRNKERAEQVVNKIEAYGQTALAAQVDLLDFNGVSQFLATVCDTWGEPSTIVYAAGPPLKFKYISQIEPDMFRQIMESDIFGCYNLIYAGLPSLRNTKGAFVGLSTPAIEHYTKRDILSVAPKAAIHSVVRGIASEEGRFGVRANSVGLGLVGDAGLFESLRENGDIDDKFMRTTYERVPLGRLGRAEEIAEAVTFLASERASFITGQLLMADGGLST